MRSLVLLLCVISVVNGITDEELLCHNNATRNQYPYLVRIMYSNKVLCGGTIINNHYVLTSAICVYFQEIDELVVVAGTNSSHEGGISYLIREVHWHPKYNETRASYNIGLIRVFGDIEFSNTIQPITLSSSLNISVGEVVILPEWGVSVINMRRQLIWPRKCNSYTGISTDPYKICMYTLLSGVYDPQPCMSEFGNPLMDKCIQIGIANNDTTCTPYSNHIHTMIAPHITWIQNIAGPISQYPSQSTVSAGNQAYLNTWIVLSHEILMLLSYSYSRL